MKSTIVIGGGAGGMMAAIIAARCGNKVTIIESNEKLGKKLYITGKGRCNLTNYTVDEDFASYIVRGKKFMYSAMSKFNSYDVYSFFEELGVPLKVERGDRVFPMSDKSSDIIKALTKELNRLYVSIRLKTKAVALVKQDDKIIGVKLSEGEILTSDNIIIATGGLSYKTTGSTGDGYNFGKTIGHNIVECYPALCPIEFEKSTHELQGLSLKNVKLIIEIDNKIEYDSIGEMLFTNKGISGPIVLTASSIINRKLTKNSKAIIDLKPYLTLDELDNRLIRDFQKYSNKVFKNSLDDLLPNKLIDYFIKLSNINPFTKVNSITKEQRNHLCYLLKNMTFNIKKLASIDEAIITSGGVDTKEIDPKTMQSKFKNNVYFVGEVLDVDCLTGGFNLGITFATAYVAGTHCANSQ